MARVLILYAHPGQKHSSVNVDLARVGKDLSDARDDITFADLYAEYPRFNIQIEQEQARLVEHDAILFQFPIFWYATPSLLKEWFDLVLEYGFAYGAEGRALEGKLFLPVVTAGGAEDAYMPDGQNNFTLRTLLSPLEQTATLCRMRFIPPLALFSALKAREDGRAAIHAQTYRHLLEALAEDRFDLEAAQSRDLLSDQDLPLLGGN